MTEDKRRVEVIVSLWVDEDTDVAELVDEMDYQFTVNGQELETEITDVFTEF